MTTAQKKPQPPTSSTLPNIWTYAFDDTHVKVTAGNIQFPNNDVTTIALSSSITVGNNDKVYLQRALDRTFSFGAGSAYPTDKAYFPLAMTAVSGAVITGITRYWNGGDIQWPAVELHWVIPFPLDENYPLILNAQERIVIDQLIAKTATGTCTATLKIDGTAITGINAVAINTSANTFSATVGCVLNPGKTLMLTMASSSSSEFLSLSVHCL